MPKAACRSLAVASQLKVRKTELKLSKSIFAVVVSTATAQHKAKNYIDHATSSAPHPEAIASEIIS